MVKALTRSRRTRRSGASPRRGGRTVPVIGWM